MTKTEGKKGAAGTAGTAGTALQTEVHTDEEWAELLTRPGLVVVDVYSEWSGPCAAMLSTLRKIKMEIGGDTISYAVARCEDISDLQRFRGKSEPAWIFLENGRVVNFASGAHSPQLQQLLVDEIRRVQENRPAKWNVEAAERTPREETRWKDEEAARKAAEEEERARAEAEEKARHDAFMAQMTFELCEETGLIFYPWVFRDEEGKPRDKIHSPPYTELVQEDLFRRYFDVLEETRVQLNEEIIEKMLLESNLEITEEFVAGLTEGKCMALRVKGRPPPPEWPVPYPHSCPEGTKKCPTRAIDDVETYLLAIVSGQADPLLAQAQSDASPRASAERTHSLGAYADRHVYVHQPDPQVDGDFHRVHPAVWIPPNARSKVHLLKSLFSDYMNFAHAYEEPVAPPPLCAFKFHSMKFPAVREAYELYREAVEHFGAFEFDGPPPLARRLVSSPDDFETKVREKTGGEVFLVILRRINQEVFYAFAGIDPYYVSEDNEEAEKMMSEYFPEGSVDAIFDILAEAEQRELAEYLYEEDFPPEAGEMMNYREEVFFK